MPSSSRVVSPAERHQNRLMGERLSHGFFTLFHRDAELMTALAKAPEVDPRSLFVSASTDGRRCTLELWNRKPLALTHIAMLKRATARARALHTDISLLDRVALTDAHLVPQGTWVYGVGPQRLSIRHLAPEQLFLIAFLLPELEDCLYCRTSILSPAQQELLASDTIVEATRRHA